MPSACRHIRLLRLLVALTCTLLCTLHLVDAASVLGSWTDSYSFPTVAALFNLHSLGATDVQQLAAATVSDATSIAALLSSDVDFALTATPLTDTQAAAHPSLTILPAMSEAVAVVYRVDKLLLPAGTSLTLSRASLALIYAGNVTMWNDARLQSDNPTLLLPNASIVVAYQADSSAVSLAFTSAIHSFLPSTASYLSPSSQPSWPVEQYAASISGSGVTGVAAVVGNTNNAIGFCLHSVALTYGNNVASIVNRKNSSVAPSTSGVTLAVYELQVTSATPLTAFPQLIDCSTLYCYSIVITTYLLLDNTASPRGCDVRCGTLDFWTWYYWSSMAYSEIYSEWQVVALPSLLVNDMSILSLLQSAMTCNGTELSNTETGSSSVVELEVQGPSRIEPALNAFAEFYSSSESTTAAQSVNIEYVASTSSQAMNWTQQTGGPSLLYLSEIPSTMSTEGERYLALPSFITSVALIYNRQLSPTVTLNSSVPFTIDFSILTRIVAGNITTFYDDAILALNPALALALDGKPAPITWTFGCLLSPSGSPLFEAIQTAVFEAQTVDPSIAASLALMGTELYTNAVFNCTQLPGVQWQYAQSEQLIPALVDNVIGSIGYAMDLSSSTAGQIQISYPYIDAAGIQHSTVRASTPEALLACARAAFNPDTLTIDVSQGALSDPTCYPLAQVAYAYLPRSYPTSQAAAGLDMVESLQWIYETAALDDWANASMFVRAAHLPAVQSSLIDALQSITGDSGTLLKPPITWKLSTSIRVAGIALASLGLLLTVVAAVVVVLLRQHAVFRSAAPLLMLVSFGGLLHVFSAIIFLVLTPSSFTCGAFNWCIQFGFDLVLAPIVFKAWRIWRIFGRRKLHVVKLSNRKLLVAIAVIMACDLVFVAAWYATSPPSVVHSSQFVSTGGVLDLLQETDYASCSYGNGQSKGFFATESVMKGAVLLAGVLLAFSTRRVTGQFNESRSVALVIYNIVFAIGVIIPILVLIDAVGDVQTILLFFCLAEIGFATLAVLFLPKLLQYKASQLLPFSEAAVTSESYTFIPLDTISTATQLGAYINALQRHMDEARKAMLRYKLNTLGRTPSALTPASVSNAKQGPGEPRESVSVDQAPVVGGVDLRSSSPSVRGSSRVQPQPSPDSTHRWRFGQSNKLAPLWSPPRSTRSDPADTTQQSEQQAQQRQQQTAHHAQPK